MNDTAKNPAAKHVASAKEHESWLDSTWADIVGGVVTIGTGLIAASHHVRRIFYQNIKIRPEFKDKIHESVDKTNVVLDEVKAAPKGQKKPLIREKLPPLHHEHNKAIDGILRDNYEIENTLDKFRLLRPHQKLEVVTKVGATMAVTLGVVATALSMRSMFKEQKRLDARLNSIEENNSSRTL